MTDRPRRRSRPGDGGRIKVVDLLPPRYDPPPKPRAPKTPLFFFGRRDEITLNWEHWAAPLWVLFQVFILIPLQIVVFVVLGVALGISKGIRKLRGLPVRSGWRW